MTARHRSSQDGYALVAVLVAIGVFSLVVMALLGLVGTDSSTTRMADDGARTRRAGDGALDAAIAQMKSTSAARLLKTTDPCAGLAATDGGAPKLAVTIEGLAATVDCTALPAGTSDMASVPSDGAGGDVLTLTGQYDISVDKLGADITNFFEKFHPPGATLVTPGFAHIANAPTKVWGNVKVSRWGLVSTPKPSPAITVTGTYAQGDADDGACGGWEVGSDLLALGRTFEAKAGATGTSRTCGSSSTASAAAGAGVAPPAATGTSVTLPACDNPVVKLPHGAYTPSQVDTLNGWFKAGTCDNVTFWFEPGDYYFDATTNRYSAAALVFDDPTSEFVFGTPSGWLPPQRATAAFPEACDRTAPGVAILLGPTTSIQQVAGRVAMCGTPGTTMLNQQAAATVPDEAWAGEPGTVTAESNTVPDPTFVQATVAVPGGQPAGYPALGKRYDGTETPTRKTSNFSCTVWSGYSCGYSYLLADLGDPTSRPSARPLTTAKLKVVGSGANIQAAARSANVGDSRFVVSVYLQGGKTVNGVPQGDCFPVRNGWLTSMGTAEIDLFPACKGVIKTAQDLESAKIGLSILINGSSCGFLCVNTPSVALDYAWVETHTGDTVTPPLPMNVNIDPASATTPRSFNAYGDISLPRTQIDVKWRGATAVTPAKEVPVFVGSVVAKALASSTLDAANHIGPLAAKTLIPVDRHVRLRAVIGNQVVRTAEIEIADHVAAASGPPAITPGVSLKVTDWRYCTVPETPSATC